MSESSVLHRHPKTRNFTQVENDTIRDSRLSFRATGLLIYLLSLPHGSRIDSNTLTPRKREGRDAIRSAYDELREVGYVHRERKQHEDGKWSTIIHVYEVPMTDSQASVSQASENQSSVSQALSLSESNTDEKEGEIGLFVCPRPDCFERFPTLEERDKHYDHCFGDEFTPADEIEVSQS